MAEIIAKELCSKLQTYLLEHRGTEYVNLWHSYPVDQKLKEYDIPMIGPSGGNDFKPYVLLANFIVNIRKQDIRLSSKLWDTIEFRRQRRVYGSTATDATRNRLFV